MHQRILAGIILSLTAATSNAALLGRLPATQGGTDYQAVYDSTQNISWLADANLASTSGYCNTTTCEDFGGLMNWSQAQAWIASLNSAGYLGVNDWRLPNTAQPDATCSAQLVVSGFPNQGYATGCTGSEMGYLYNVDGIASGTQSPFSNVQPWLFWSGTEYAPHTGSACTFSFDSGAGAQRNPSKGGLAYAWAVRPGDIAPVPIPAAVWLLGSALGVLGWVRRPTSSTGV